MDFCDLSYMDAPLMNTIPPGPESQQYLDDQLSHESSAVSYPKGMPMAIRRARGATVQDMGGNGYIDFFWRCRDHERGAFQSLRAGSRHEPVGRAYTRPRFSKPESKEARGRQVDEGPRSGARKENSYGEVS